MPAVGYIRATVADMQQLHIVQVARMAAVAVESNRAVARMAVAVGPAGIAVGPAGIGVDKHLEVAAV